MTVSKFLPTTPDRNRHIRYMNEEYYPWVARSVRGTERIAPFPARSAFADRATLGYELSRSELPQNAAPWKFRPVPPSGTIATGDLIPGLISPTDRPPGATLRFDLGTRVGSSIDRHPPSSDPDWIELSGRASCNGDSALRLLGCTGLGRIDFSRPGHDSGRDPASSTSGLPFRASCSARFCGPDVGSVVASSWPPTSTVATYSLPGSGCAWR